VRAAAAALLLALLAAPAAAIGENEDDDALPSMNRTGGFVLYYDSMGPMSFVAMTPRDVPKDAKMLGEVSGVSCQRGVSIPLTASIRATSVSAGFGDGSYKKAVEEIKRKNPTLAGIYDVKVDLGQFSILGGLYRSLCTYVTARGFSAAERPTR
jgi:hypothetical protein